MVKQNITSKFPLFLVTIGCILVHSAAFTTPRLITHQGPAFTTTSLFSSDPDNENDSAMERADRIKACIPYILPLLDGDHFGQYIYMRVPFLGLLDDLFLAPMVAIFEGAAYLGILLFLGFTLGTWSNPNLSRNVRFNAQQAAMIDVVLIIPAVLSSFLTDDDIPRYLAEPCSNFVYFTYMSMIIYSVYCNLNGKKPDQIPFISSTADSAAGPF